MRLLPEWSERLEAYVAPARRRPALWRTIVGLLFAAAFWLFTVGMTLPSVARTSGLASPAGLRFYLLGFAGLAVGIVLAALVLQWRGPRSLIDPGGLRPSAVGIGVLAVCLLGAPSFLVTVGFVPLSQQIPTHIWAIALPITLPLVFLQSFTEELVFRGYLMSSLAARFRSPIVWWIMPALAFAILHWNPADLGANAWLAVIAAFISGLVLGDITAGLGNLSVAVGLHFANNVFALLVLAAPSEISHLSLFVLYVPPDDTSLIRSLMLLDAGSTLVGWTAWRFLWRRRRLHSGGAGSI